MWALLEIGILLLIVGLIWWAIRPNQRPPKQ